MVKIIRMISYHWLLYAELMVTCCKNVKREPNDFSLMFANSKGWCMKVWLRGQLSSERMSETKTKVDLKYELDEYDDGTKKSVVVDCKNHR